MRPNNRLRTLKDMDTNTYEGVEYWMSVCYCDPKAKDKLIGPFSTEKTAFQRASEMEVYKEVIYALVTSTPLAKCLSHRAEIIVV